MVDWYKESKFEMRYMYWWPIQNVWCMTRHFFGIFILSKISGMWSKVGHCLKNFSNHIGQFQSIIVFFLYFCSFFSHFLIFLLYIILFWAQYAACSNNRKTITITQTPPSLHYTEYKHHNRRTKWYNLH